MAIMIIASKISHWPVFLDVSEWYLATPDLYMDNLKMKQYGQSSNQNLIMTRGKFNKTFTSAAIVLQFEEQYTCK